MRIGITFIIAFLLYSQHILDAHEVLYVMIDLAETETATKTNMIRRRSGDQY